MLEVMRTAYDRGMGIGKVPQKNDVEAPRAITPSEYLAMEPDKQKTYRLKLHVAKKENQKLVSTRPTFRLRLGVAGRF